MGLWAFYKMEYLMSNINRLDLPAMGRGLGLLYLSLLGIFLLIHYVVYYKRYQQNKKRLAAYNHILKQLSHIYQTAVSYTHLDVYKRQASDGAGSLP